MKRVESTAGNPRASNNHALDQLVLVHASACLYRAKPLQPTGCPFPDHHPDALTEAVGTPKLAFAPLLLLLLLHFFCQENHGKPHYAVLLLQLG